MILFLHVLGLGFSILAMVLLSLAGAGLPSVVLSGAIVGFIQWGFVRETRLQRHREAAMRQADSKAKGKDDGKTNL